jgi:hypothetical protein
MAVRGSTEVGGTVAVPPEDQEVPLPGLIRVLRPQACQATPLDPPIPAAPSPDGGPASCTRTVTVLGVR